MSDYIKLGKCTRIPIIYFPVDPLGTVEALNPSFENFLNGQVGPSGFAVMPAANVEGWESTPPQIEVWASGFLGVPSYDGNYHIEMNANSPGRLSQSFATPVTRSALRWQVAHRGRNGVDTAEVIISQDGVDTVVETMATGNTEWQVYSGVIVKECGIVEAEIAFNAVGGGSSGNFLDDVQLEMISFSPDCVLAFVDNCRNVYDADDVYIGTIQGDSLITNDGAVTGSFCDPACPLEDQDNQLLTLLGNVLSISGGNSIDLTPYLDNTDDQVLSITRAGDVLNYTLEDGGFGSIDLSDLRDNTDDQVLSLVGDTLTLENGGTVDLSQYEETATVTKEQIRVVRDYFITSAGSVTTIGNAGPIPVVTWTAGSGANGNGNDWVLTFPSAFDNPAIQVTVAGDIETGSGGDIDNAQVVQFARMISPTVASFTLYSGDDGGGEDEAGRRDVNVRISYDLEVVTDVVVS